MFPVQMTARRGLEAERSGRVASRVLCWNARQRSQDGEDWRCRTVVRSLTCSVKSEWGHSRQLGRDMMESNDV